MAFGVTPTGFNKKTLDDIKSELEEEERDQISPALNLATTSLFGQLNSIFGDKLREMWDVCEAVYRSLYPDSAEGDALDNLAALNNARRLPATFSTVDVLCTGTPGTLLPAGRIVSVLGSLDRFSSLADAVIEVDGILVTFAAQVTGPIPAPAGQLVTIVTPVSGWAAATNPLDAVPGSDIENDVNLRLRRLTVLAAPGDTTDAVLAVVKAVPGVTNALVFENTDLVTDVSGVPGKSFETVVEGGDDNEIAAAIYSKKPAGIQAYGTTTIGVADSQGTNHFVGFSRPNEVPIFIKLTVNVNAAVFGSGDPAAGILLVQEAIVAVGDALLIGNDVIALKIEATALNVPGVNDVTAFLIGIVDPPISGANVVIATRELATFDTGRIEVTVVNA